MHCTSSMWHVSLRNIIYCFYEFSNLNNHFNVSSNFNESVLHEDINAKLGSTVEMKCSISGYPLPNIEWRSLRTRNRLLIPDRVQNATMYDLTSYLVLHNLTKNERGVYSCSIAGSQYKTKTFTVIIQSNNLLHWY